MGAEDDENAASVSEVLEGGLAIKGKEMKYKVVRRDARNYEVTDMSIAPFFGNYRPSVGVWVDEAGGTRCCECSSMTVAMLASCAHCRAVKRALKKQRKPTAKRERK